MTTIFPSSSTNEVKLNILKIPDKKSNVFIFGKFDVMLICWSTRTLAFPVNVICFLPANPRKPPPVCSIVMSAVNDEAFSASIKNVYSPFGIPISGTLFETPFVVVPLNPENFLNSSPFCFITRPYSSLVDGVIFTRIVRVCFDSSYELLKYELWTPLICVMSPRTFVKSLIVYCASWSSNKEPSFV